MLPEIDENSETSENEENVDHSRNNNFLDIKVFEVCESEGQILMNIKDIINYDRSHLKDIVFRYAP